MTKTFGLEIKDISRKDVERIERFVSKFVQSHNVTRTYYNDGVKA